jgi:hypothetical protein
MIIYIMIRTHTIIALVLLCAAFIYCQKNTVNKSAHAGQTGKYVSDTCIPEEPERKVIINGTIGVLSLNETITLPPGPLTLCEKEDGGFIGEGGGTGSVCWYQGSITGEYVKDSDGKNRIRIIIDRAPLSPDHKRVKKEYTLLLPEFPKTFIDDDSNIALSVCSP